MLLRWVRSKRVDPPRLTLAQAPQVSKGLFSEHVLRTQAAIGCPLRGYSFTPHMPLLSQEEAAAVGMQHREKIPTEAPMPPLNALVARPVGRKERDANQSALDAVAKEWARLRSIKHKDGVGVWDEKRVEERWKVSERAN